MRPRPRSSRTVLAAALAVASSCGGPAGPDPKQLVVLSTTSIGAGSAYGVAAQGGLVYANDAYGSSIVRVNKGTDPQFVGSLESLPRVFVGNRAIEVKGPTLYRGHSSRFETVDVSTPATPKLLASVEGSGLVMDLVLVGAVAYVAFETGGVVAYDVTTPSSPKPLGPVLAQAAYAVAADERNIYVANQTQFFVVQVLGPGQYQLLATREGGARALALNGARVYASVNNAVSVIDVSDPSNPVMGHTTGGAAQSGGLALAGGYLYQAGTSPGGWAAQAVGSDGALAAPVGALMQSEVSDVALADGFIALATTQGVSLLGPRP